MRPAVRSGQRIPPVLIEVLRDDIESVSQALHSCQSQAERTRLRNAAVALVPSGQRHLIGRLAKGAVQITNSRRDGICVGPERVSRPAKAAEVVAERVVIQNAQVYQIHETGFEVENAPSVQRFRGAPIGAPDGTMLVSCPIGDILFDGFQSRQPEVLDTGPVGVQPRASTWPSVGVCTLDQVLDMKVLECRQLLVERDRRNVRVAVLIDV